MTFDSRELREVLGRFATGVCVISTMRQGATAVGITANSFSSVSLDPPLVLWSLQNSSERYQEFSVAPVFAISVLAREQEHLSTFYARRGVESMDADHYSVGRLGTPLVRGAVATMECELETTHEAGDHLIIIGRVRFLKLGSTEPPLLFFAGDYRSLAP